MTREDMIKLKEQAKAKGKALADAHKGKPPKATTKGMDTSKLKKKSNSSNAITVMIARIIQELDENIDRLIGDMDVNEALDVIERLQNLRDTENYHGLKWGN